MCIHGNMSSILTPVHYVIFGHCHCNDLSIYIALKGKCEKDDSTSAKQNIVFAVKY